MSKSSKSYKRIPGGRSRPQSPRLVSFAMLFALLLGDGLAWSGSTVAAAPAPAGVLPSVDVPAPQASDAEGGVSSGAQAERMELDDAALAAGMSVWYRLAYNEGGNRLRVFEHYAATTRGPESDMVQSESMAWQFANAAVGSDRGHEAFGDPPRWLWFRTGNDTGPSAGLMFTLAYIDLLTPGALVGDLRVVGTGGIRVDGVVTPVSNVEVKVAAAMLTRPDVIFAPRAPTTIEDVTIVESEHTRFPTSGAEVGEWLNVSGYEQAGRAAASHPGSVAVVVVHDARQALAWLCGRTSNATTCSVARTAASVPIGVV